MAVIDYYIANVLSVKTRPSRHVLVSHFQLLHDPKLTHLVTRIHTQTAFNDFFAATITTEADITAQLLPAMEKAVLRSPEVGMTVLASFFAAELPEQAATSAIKMQVLSSVLTGAKSTSAPTRAAAVELFKHLFCSDSKDQSRRNTHEGNPSDTPAVVEQISALFKAGKTSSADHRCALFSMLAAVSAGPSTSLAITTLALSSLTKETGHEPTVLAIADLVTHHLPSALSEDANGTLPSAAIAALVKAMQEPKPVVRRAAHAAVASAIMAIDTTPSPSAVAFAEGVLPGWESALKTVLSNALNAPAGPMEGYCAVAVFKGRLAGWKSKKIGEPS